jgi:hypothetical protein
MINMDEAYLTGGAGKSSSPGERWIGIGIGTLAFFYMVFLFLKKYLHSRKSRVNSVDSTLPVGR